MSDDRGGDGDSGGDGQGDGEPGGGQQPSTAEKAVTAISVAFTLLLFGYAAWQMATPPEAGTPEVTVSNTESLPNGSVAVTVGLRNPSDVGLVTVTVESGCEDPPPDVEFSYVPADSTRTGTLVCPEGTTNPSVSVSSWVSR